MNKAFDDFTWYDEPNHSTPLSSANLNKINTALDTIDDRVITHDSTLQPKSDASLSTSSHTVVGAINEINDWSLAVVDGELCIKYEEA